MTKSKEENSAKKASAPKKTEVAKKVEAAPKKASTPKKAPAPKKTEFAVGALVLDHKDREYTILEMPAQLSDYSKIVLKDSQGKSLVRLKLKLRLK